MPPVTIAACALNGQNQLAYVQNIFFFFFLFALNVRNRGLSFSGKFLWYKMTFVV